MAKDTKNHECDYCDGKGEIETDNNGPIVPCPVCSPENNTGGIPDIRYVDKLNRKLTAAWAWDHSVYDHEDKYYSESHVRQRIAEEVAKAVKHERENSVSKQMSVKLIQQARKEERERLRETIMHEANFYKEEITSQLMSRGIGGVRIYGCDEWSGPVVNLKGFVNRLDAILTPEDSE